MPQSLAQIYTHIVFSTKYRMNTLTWEIQPELFSYLAGTCNRLECCTLNAGGFLDHVHILCMLSRKIAVMDLLQEIKTSSSRWIKTKGEEFSGFHWQDGYGAFSVSPGHAEEVIKYISRQAEHHMKHSFQDEYRTILKKYKVEYDERYVWD